MRNIRSALNFAPLWLAVAGCSVASAAEGGGPPSGAARTVGAPPSPAGAAFAADAPPPHKPPQAAFDACKSSSEGAACRVSFDGHTMTGTCRKGPNGETELVCVPAHPPGPPPSQSNQTLTESALERKLDRLEREIQGS